MAHQVRITAALPLAMLSMLSAGSCASELDTSPSPSPSAVQQKETSSTVELAVAACAGNTGEVLAVYQGVPFYSNGSCTGTWAGAHQCPEVVKRYNQHMDWHGHARTYCDPDAARERNQIFLPDQREPPGRNGDIVAFDGPSCGKGVGHVGLRCGTPDATHWQLCDQNRAWSAFDNPVELNGDRIDQIRIDPVREAGFSSDEDVLDIDWMRLDP